MAERDLFVDSFKGLVILWVIHIHTVFWTGYYYLPDSIRQMSLLIDVPIFFFISGYLVKPADIGRLFRKPLKQFVRLYGGYLGISCLVLSGLFLSSLFIGFAGPGDLVPGIKSMVRVRPEGGLWEPVRVYKADLWFIRVFLSLLVFVPGVIALAGFRRLRLIALALLFLAFTLFRYQGWDHSFLFSGAQYVLFYLIFYLMGTIYRGEERSLGPRFLTFSLLLTLLLCGWAFLADGGRLVLQENKFPPSFQYLVYSLPLIHVFGLSRLLWKNPLGGPFRRVTGLLAWCGVNVFAVYLFQGVACSLPYLFVPALARRLPPLGTYGVVLAFNVAVTLVLTLLYTRLGAMVTGKSDSSRHWPLFPSSS
jgi:surface polysaccharide O-acyltransferase-like enzyme